MNEHLSDDQVTMYTEKRLTPGDLLLVDRHLSGCEACRRRLGADIGRVLGSLEDFDEEPAQHVTYEQLAAYLDNNAGNDREFVALHIKDCSRCRAEYEDLRAFSVEMGSTKARKSSLYRLAALAAVIAGIALVAYIRLQESGDPNRSQPAPRSTPIAVSIKDAGTRITLDLDGKLSGLNDAPANYRQMVLAALQTQQLEISKSVDPLITQGGYVRGEPQNETMFHLVKPVGTMVLPDRPAFEWQALSGATKYRVTVLEANMAVALDSGWLQTTTWTADRPLKRDATYIWQVVASKDGAEVMSPQPPAGEARFRVVDLPTWTRLEEDRKKYSNSLLLVGLLYAKHGLLDDAQQNFQELLKANPNSREIQQLLKKVGG